ncbi:hypothetical protein APHAL10511_008053 [Amanita phalloides]|nr:hypothetical protein APHAL10511_008053 [Amanita phalloides]
MPAKLSPRKIRNTPVSSIGFGLMNISRSPEPDEERFKVLDAAYEDGCTFWDTADIYGDSEDLIGRWLKRTGKRDEIFIGTKFGFVGNFGKDWVVDGKEEHVKAAFEKSRKRLGIETIDLYYLHRVDINTPIEHTVGAMAELVKDGKVKYLGLCEVSAATLRRAHAVHPIAAVQVEYSPFTTDIEDEKIGLLKACRELGVAVVAYAPLGRGLLTGQVRSPDDFEEGELRRLIPRFSKENFPNILKVADGIKAIGERHNVTAGQVALAWILAQGEDFIPIPGTRKIKYLKENIAAAQVKLSPEEVKEVREMANSIDTSSDLRAPPNLLKFMFADTPSV